MKTTVLVELDLGQLKQLKRICHLAEEGTDLTFNLDCGCLSNSEWWNTHSGITADHVFIDFIEFKKALDKAS